MPVHLRPYEASLRAMLSMVQTAGGCDGSRQGAPSPFSCSEGGMIFGSERPCLSTDMARVVVNVVDGFTEEDVPFVLSSTSPMVVD